MEAREARMTQRHIGGESEYGSNKYEMTEAKFKGTSVREQANIWQLIVLIFVPDVETKGSREPRK